MRSSQLHAQASIIPSGLEPLIKLAELLSNHVSLEEAKKPFAEPLQPSASTKRTLLKVLKLHDQLGKGDYIKNALVERQIRKWILPTA